MQKRQIEAVAFEVKINAMEGKVEVWKSVFWRCGFIGLPFPLRYVSNVREI